jgi:hypothetical protein
MGSLSIDRVLRRVKIYFPIAEMMTRCPAGMTPSVVLTALVIVYLAGMFPFD